MTTKLTAPKGWILGTECGYKSHAGFVKDCGPGHHWSLSPARNGSGWMLARIANGIPMGERPLKFATLEDAVVYVGMQNDTDPNMKTGTAPATAAVQYFLEGCQAVKEIREAGDHFEFDYDADIEVSHVPAHLKIEW